MSNVLEQTATSVSPDALHVIEESVFEPDPNAGRAFQPQSSMICSIWPENLEKFFMHAGTRKRYALPAAPKGQYSLLRVYDTWTPTRRPGSQSDGPESMQRSPVYCEPLAKELIRHWAQDAPGNKSGAQPGIVVIAADRPTQMELDQMWATQTEYFRYLVMMADSNWITGKREYITEDHRRALKWLGSEDRDWFKKIASIQFKACPNCAEEININALGCKHCQINLPKFYREAGLKDSEVTAEVDYAVWSFYQNRAAHIAASNAAGLAAAHAKKSEKVAVE